ncbi:hypothetical protein LX36DRAFT_21089 [Colletotrichum falcatum]|nr:hypothetical protein LX36DRAFT_21089 [Colletotrichum falcatum]
METGGQGESWPLPNPNPAASISQAPYPPISHPSQAQQRALRPPGNQPTAVNDTVIFSFGYSQLPCSAEGSRGERGKAALSSSRNAPGPRQTHCQKVSGPPNPNPAAETLHLLTGPAPRRMRASAMTTRPRSDAIDTHPPHPAYPPVHT